MDEPSLPVIYEQLTEEDIQAHLRYCASKLKDGDRAEVMLCEAGVTVPIVKRVHRTGPATLDVLARSGSISRDKLVKLKARLSSDGYELRLSFTSKRKLLSRIAVPLRVDDPFLPLSGISVLRSIALELDTPFPCTASIGYPLEWQDRRLPGRLTYRDFSAQSGHNVGWIIGNLIRRILS